MTRRQRFRLAHIPADKPADHPDAVPFPSRDLLLSQVQALLSPAFVESVYATRSQGLRKRLLPLPLMALLLVSFCCLQMVSFAAMLDDLAAGTLSGLPSVSVAPQAFYQRLAALGHERFLVLLREVTSVLRSSTWRRSWVQALAPWATGIYAVDDTTLDALVRRVPELAAFAKGSPEVLAGRLSTALDLTTGKLAEVLFDRDSAANEKPHLLPLLSSLPLGSLFVIDLGYFAFPLFDQLTTLGYFFVTRLRAKTSYRVLQVLVDQPLYRDRVIYLGAHWNDRAAHPYRLVELNLAGKWWSYVTNVLDPHQLSATSVWRLYLERWGIEQAFFSIKRVLGLASLRCSNQDGVLAQIWSTLTVYQLVQDLRLQVAEAQGLNADDVSWERLVRHLAIYTKLPSPRPALGPWLKMCKRLKKKGTRERRSKTLPAEVQAACEQAMAEMPALQTFAEREAKQGKPEPRKKPQVLTKANLAREGAKT